MPSLQVCPQCLSDDLGSLSGIQFLRLRWQCAGMTVCPKHLVPLHEACLGCRRFGWPVCEKTASRRFRFRCNDCGSCQESGWSGDEPTAAAVRLLARFESQLRRALANYKTVWPSLGQSTPEEFRCLITDLLCLLTRPRRDEKPIYKPQTNSFPLFNPLAPELAAILAIVGSPRVRSVLLGKGEQQSPWHKLLFSLSEREIADLERRSWHWPPVAHNALRRAAQFPRGKKFFLPFSTDLRKTRSKLCKFY